MEDEKLLSQHKHKHIDRKRVYVVTEVSVEVFHVVYNVDENFRDNVHSFSINIARTFLLSIKTSVLSS